MKKTNCKNSRAGTVLYPISPAVYTYKESFTLHAAPQKGEGEHLLSIMTLPSLSMVIYVRLTAHAHRPAPYCTITIRPPFGATRLYTMLPFTHTEMQNGRLLRGHVFTKFAMRTTSSSTGNTASGKILAMRTSLCRKQFITVRS